MSNLRFVIVVVVLIGKPPLMGEVLCSTENSPFLIIDHSCKNKSNLLRCFGYREKMYECKEK